MLHPICLLYQMTASVYKIHVLKSVLSVCSILQMSSLHVTFEQFFQAPINHAVIRVLLPWINENLSSCIVKRRCMRRCDGVKSCVQLVHQSWLLQIPSFRPFCTTIRYFSYKSLIFSKINVLYKNKVSLRHQHFAKMYYLCTTEKITAILLQFNDLYY